MKIDTHFFRDFDLARGCSAGILIACGLVLASCSIIPEPAPDPTRYYVLGSAAATEVPAGVPKGKLHVGIRAIELPLYLRNNRTIVVRTGANEIRYQDYARWAEPLDLAVQHILRDRLMANETVEGAEIAPFSTDVQRDFDVVVRILQCEGSAEGRNAAQFSATYELFDQRNGGSMVARKTFTAPPKDWDGANYAALAAAISDDVAALGNDIASSLPH